jgi:hypothetical protein
VLSYCSKVLPCSFRIIFYLTHPISSHPVKHNDIRIEQPGLQFRTSMRKRWGPDSLGPGSEEWEPVPWGGPEPVWPVSLVPYPKPRTLHHSVMGALVFGAISPVGSTTWGPKLEKRCLSPGVVRSRVAAQPGPVPWACTFHHPTAGVLVPRTTIHGVRKHNLAPPG